MSTSLSPDPRREASISSPQHLPRPQQQQQRTNGQSLSFQRHTSSPALSLPRAPSLIHHAQLDSPTQARAFYANVAYLGSDNEPQQQQHYQHRYPPVYSSATEALALHNAAAEGHYSLFMVDSLNDERSPSRPWEYPALYESNAEGAECENPTSDSAHDGAVSKGSRLGPTTFYDRCLQFLKTYGRRLRGRDEPAPVLRPFDSTGLLACFLVAFTSMLLVSALHYKVFKDRMQTQFFIAPFGATAAIVASMPEVNAAQPRSVFFGHVLCAIVGVSMNHVLPDGDIELLFAGPLALAVSLLAMQALKIVHPPGCATVLLAVYAPEHGIAWAGYLYVLYPISTGAFLIVLVAWLANNLFAKRVYPRYW